MRAIQVSNIQSIKQLKVNETMYEIEKEELLKYASYLDRYQLITLSGGNLSLKIGDHVITTPSGMIYEDMISSDFVVVDLKGKQVEGHRRPSVDLEAILYMFNYLPEINAIIHTHQPFATAIGLIGDEFPCNITTLANSAKGSVSVAPYTSAATKDMGVKAVEHLNGKNAVILKHHGFIGVGKSLKEALYACVYTEEAAKTYLAAVSTQMPIAMLTEDQIQESVRVFDSYGQSK